MQMLRSLRCVDVVRPYFELEYVSGCRELDVDIFVVGEDWGDKPHNIDVENFLKSKGSEIVKVNYDLRTSSSQIKKDVLAQPVIGRELPHAIAGGPKLGAFAL
jgi:glycerol-3-phosphate cytidylyltransferase-like family protein